MAIVNGDRPGARCVAEWEAMAAPSLAVEPPSAPPLPGVRAGAARRARAGERRASAWSATSTSRPRTLRLRRAARGRGRSAAARAAAAPQPAADDGRGVAPRRGVRRRGRRRTRSRCTTPSGWRRTRRVRQPGAASSRRRPQKLLAEHPPDPQAVTIARQFRDVREAVRELAGHDDALLPGGPLAPAVAAVVDTSSHRFDPWVTALATRRLRRLIGPRRAAAHRRVRLGRRPRPVRRPDAADDAPASSTRPGSAQALAAAVLRDHADRRRRRRAGR